jgi:large subunit ribosomal protein L24
MSKWIKKEDNVVIIAGNDKGKTGKVLSRSIDRVIVQGINIRRKHMKKTQKTQQAQIVDLEMPISISNVCLCTTDGKKMKVKSRVTSDKKKELYYLENGKEVVLRQLKK